jgi:hypothetical protein
MKLFYSILLAILFVMPVFAQKDGEAAKDPWFEDFTRAPFQQGKDGSILLEIKNTGTDVTQCITKAKQQAVFAVIFTGYTEANNTPSAPAISPTDVALYHEKIDFFKEFLTNTSQYGTFVPKADINPNKPVSKIDKKTVEANIIVTVEIDRLRKSLEAQGIIKSIVAFGFKPSVLIVPSDEWMTNYGYVTKKDNQGITEDVYDYPNAIKDERISKAIMALANKFGGPTGAFDIQDMKAKLDDIKLEEQKNNARDASKKESTMDLFARVLAADLWIKIDFTENALQGGLTTQFIITLSATDPYTGQNAIPGKNIEKTSVGDNKFQLMTSAMNGAAEEFRPQIFAHFKKQVEKGLQGRLTVSLLSEVTFNFDTEYEYKGNEMELNRILSSIVKKNSLSATEDGSQTETTRRYMVYIPLERKDEEGDVSKNNFKDFAYQVTAQLKKLGMTYKVESSGLGKVEIIITGTKQ